MKSGRISRRTFLIGTAATMAGCATLKGRHAKIPADGKLNIAGIGVGGKGKSDIWSCRDHNVVALCDVDLRNAAESFRNFPNAKRYTDFRVMLDKHPELHGVTISTPDHTHAVAAMACMERGISVYVQKPLTHSIYETRRLQEAARKYGVATQMGNQGHADMGVRRICEMIWTGAIGEVREVHCWTNRPIWPQGMAALPEPEAVPDVVDWNLWLGPAADRPYSPAYMPFAWRGWWDFGCGALGDMACHIMDPANWSLKLKYPSSVECLSQEGLTEYAAPNKSVIKYIFPERVAEGKTWPEVTLYWHDGGNLPPRPEGIPADEDFANFDNGTIFIGEKGYITCEGYGENPKLHPEAQYKDYMPPEPFIERAPNNSPYEEWFRAIKGGKPAGSNFDYSAPFTEVVLLGNIALRSGSLIEYDAENMLITNNAEANKYLHNEYREGWTI